MKDRDAFPTDDMVVMAALLDRTQHGGGWRCAEDIASTLRRLGFIITPQKMVAQINRLLAEDSAMLERKMAPWGGVNEYRVTPFGVTQITNRFPALRGAHTIEWHRGDFRRG